MVRCGVRAEPQSWRLRKRSNGSSCSCYHAGNRAGREMDFGWQIGLGKSFRTQVSAVELVKNWWCSGCVACCRCSTRADSAGPSNAGSTQLVLQPPHACNRAAS